MDFLSIGKLAKKAGVSVQAIRFYERNGLLPTPPRSASGYRQFPPETVRLVKFIKSSQELGLKLKEISKLLSITADAFATCSDIRDFALGKIEEIEAKIKQLKQIHNALIKMTGQCPGQGALSLCPILEAISEGDRKEDKE